MRKGAILLLSLLLVLLAAPTGAQMATGPVVRVAQWKIKAGTAPQFEAGLKKHNEFHVKQNDATTIETWQITSGPDTGAYVRIVALADWAAYDTPTVDEAADEADAAANVNPYIESESVRWWRMIPEASYGPMDAATTPMDEVLFFHLNMGHTRDFMHLIGKVTHAAKENNWSVHYYWYALAHGGEHPTFALVIPKKNMAAFEEPELNFFAMLQKTFGPAETEMILKGFDKAVHCQTSHVIGFRSDLSYAPKK